MKRLLALLLAALAVITPLAAQSSAPAPSAAAYEQRPTPPQEPSLAVFDLDFPGGTPQQLVDVISKASGHPLNAIIPTELADWTLPPMRMKQVTVRSLFSALQQTPRFMRSPRMPYAGMGSATFMTQDRRVTDESVWYFFVNGPFFQSSPSLTRYYLLTPYLEAGLTVDDITTAIQTGWKMQKLDSAPVLSFHKETKLLIGVGQQGDLETIDAVLRALDPVKPKKPASPAETAAPDKKKS